MARGDELGGLWCLWNRISGAHIRVGMTRSSWQTARVNDKENNDAWVSEPSVMPVTKNVPAGHARTCARSRRWSVRAGGSMTANSRTHRSQSCRSSSEVRLSCLSAAWFLRITSLIVSRTTTRSRMFLQLVRPPWHSRLLLPFSVPLTLWLVCTVIYLYPDQYTIRIMIIVQ